jgi:hypothetical protein
MEEGTPTGPSAGASRAVYRSWKAIAGHFGASVRTVQHWELNRNLPVHRMPGERGRVYAFVDELDAWQRSAGVETEQKAGGGPKWIWAAGAALGLAAVVAAAGYWWAETRPRPDSWVVEGRDLMAVGADGEALWRHTFPKPVWRRWLAPPEGLMEYRTMPVVSDFDGDGANEVAAVYWPKDEPAAAPELLAFDSDGSPEWRYRARPAETAAGRPLEGPYDVLMVLAAPLPGRPPALVAVSNQRGGFASQVAVLSARGEVVREYWHSGHMLHADIAAAAGCGTVIYFAARHAATGRSELVALNPLTLGGASEEEDPKYRIAARTAGREVARFRFNASELARQLGAETVPADVRIRDGRVQVSVSQNGTPRGNERAAIVHHSADLMLRNFTVSYAQTFSALWDLLVGQGHLKRYDTEADARRVAAAEAVVPWQAGACAGPEQSAAN